MTIHKKGQAHWEGDIKLIFFTLSGVKSTRSE